MDAKKFIKTRRRMCGKYFGDGKCLQCPVIKTGGCGLERCAEEDLDKIVAVVEKWASEHPTKTRQSEFMKTFPNAVLADGVINVCPAKVDATYDCKSSVKFGCGACKRKYWLEEVD